MRMREVIALLGGPKWETSRQADEPNICKGRKAQC
jgi:hypothetical protein